MSLPACGQEPEEISHEVSVHNNCHQLLHTDFPPNNLRHQDRLVNTQASQRSCNMSGGHIWIRWSEAPQVQQFIVTLWNIYIKVSTSIPKYFLTIYCAIFPEDTRNILSHPSMVGLAQQMDNQIWLNCQLKRQKSIKTKVCKGQSCQMKFIDIIQCLVQAQLFIALLLSLLEGITQVHIQKINGAATTQILLFPSNQQVFFSNVAFVT